MSGMDYLQGLYANLWLVEISYEIQISELTKAVGPI